MLTIKLLTVVKETMHYADNKATNSSKRNNALC